MANLGSVPLIESYLSRIGEIIYRSTRVGESAILVWPVGNAKFLHLSELLKPSWKKQLLGKRSSLVEFLYLDCFSDLEAKYSSFLTFLSRELLGRERDEGSQLAAIKGAILDRSEEKELIFVINQLEVYPVDELKQILLFLDRLVALRPSRVNVQIHAYRGEKLNLIISHLGQSPIARNIEMISLPNSREAEQMLRTMIDRSSLKLSQVDAGKLGYICGSSILLMKTAIRLLLKEPELVKKIETVAETLEFRLKKQLISADVSEKQIEVNRLLSVRLSKTESKIMERFLVANNNFLSREEIAQIVWEVKLTEKYTDWALDKQISRLREKIFLSGVGSYIETIKGRGYRYVVQ